MISKLTKCISWYPIPYSSEFLPSVWDLYGVCVWHTAARVCNVSSFYQLDHVKHQAPPPPASFTRTQPISKLYKIEPLSSYCQLHGI